MINRDRDRLLDMLGALPSATPTAAVTERVRARCHIVLAQPPRVPEKKRWPWLVLAMSLLYLAAAAAQALTILRLT